MEFINKLPQTAIYEFASSDESVVVPKVKMQQYEGKEFKMIDLHFMLQQRTGTYRVYLYANDIDHNVVECFLLNILCIS
jgi:hypothetical protein